MIQILYYFLFCITLFYGLYYLITGLWGFTKGKERIKKFKPKNKFAILIAARNEAMVIPNLVKSLKNQDYPKDLYDIYVIPNNCSDNTAEAAKKAGANVIDCTVPVKNKGDVLRFAFSKLVDDKSIDAFLIFDADNVVDTGFLRAMNNAYCSGYKVAEGNRDSKNIDDNWLSGSYSVFYYFQNYFFSKARMNMGYSASINGTGFMVSRDIIKKHGFNTQTLTEDVEFTAMCALRDEKIAYVIDAVTYDEQPLKFSDSWKQRKRWSKGMLQCLSLYGEDLVHHFFKSGNLSCIDMTFNFLAPLMQVLSVLLIVVLFVFKKCDVELVDAFSYLFAYGILFFFLSYFMGIIMNIFILRVNHRQVNNLISTIFLFSIFMITWIPINIVCILKKDVSWDPIVHNRDIDVDNLSLKRN